MIERYDLPGYAIGVGGQGVRHVLAERRSSTTRRSRANQDVELTELAWLYNMNRGIFMTPGREEEWTLSVTHTHEAVDAYVQVFDEMARELTRSRA